MRLYLFFFQVGDIIIGLPSNGVHSNGFSLIHKLMKKAGLTLQDKAPFSKEGLTLGKSFVISKVLCNNLTCKW